MPRQLYGRTITFINLAFIWMPIILLAAMIFMMQFYRLDEKELQANKADAAAKVEPKEDVEYDANN